MNNCIFVQTTFKVPPGGHFTNLMWLSNYIIYKVWDEITFPFPCIRLRWEWISNSFPYFIWHVITYPCWDYS